MVNIPKPILYGSAIGTTCLTALLLKDIITSNKKNEEEDVKELPSAEGKVVIITGASSGIGRETAFQMARRNAKVVMACRDIDKCEKVRENIVLTTRNKFVYCRSCDLASQDSIRTFAERIKQEHSKIDVLINNASVMRVPYSKTKEGIEMHMGVNHMGHFLLTNLLLDKIKESAPSRILNITCTLYHSGSIAKEDLNSEKKYDEGDAYAQSKLATVLFTKELAWKLRGTGVTVNMVDPGFTDTELSRHIDTGFSAKVANMLVWMFHRSPQKAVEGILYTSLSPNLSTVSGKYFDGLNVVSVSRLGDNRKLAKWMWMTSEKWTGLVPSNKP